MVGTALAWDRTLRARLGLILCTVVLSAPIRAADDEVERGRAERVKELVAKVQGVSAVSITFDGRRIAVAEPGLPIRALDSRSGKWLIECGTGFNPLWSPNGNLLAVYSRLGGVTQLWVANVHEGRCDQLTHFAGGIETDPSTRVAGSVDDSYRATWSPDSSSIAFAALPAGDDSVNPRRTAVGDVSNGVPRVIDEGTPLDEITDGILPAGPASPAKGRPSQIYTVDIQSGATRQITHGTATWFQPAWSPDGRTIAAAVFSGKPGPWGALGWDTTETQIQIVDAQTGGIHVVTSGPRVKFRPTWDKSGRQLAFLSSASTLEQARVTVMPDWSHDIERRSTVDSDVEDFGWGNTESEFIVRYCDGPSTRLGRLNWVTQKINVITSSEHTPIYVQGISVGSKSIAWTQVDAYGRVAVAYLANPTIAIRWLRSSRELNQPSMAQVFKWRSPDGELFEGSLLLPPNYRRSRKYPLIVDVYPALDGATWSYPMMGNVAMAAEGYVLFRPSVTAPNSWVNSWKTEASSTRAKGLTGWERLRRAVSAGIDAVRLSYSVDADRICLYGFSNGGGVAAYLLANTDTYKCAVITAPVLTNILRQSYFDGDNDSGAIEHLYGQGEKPLDPQTLFALSSVFMLGNGRTSVMLSVGDRDVGALLNCVEIYHALRRYGRKVTFYRYPDQAHGFTGKALRDYVQRYLNFFRQELN